MTTILLIVAIGVTIWILLRKPKPVNAEEQAMVARDAEKVASPQQAATVAQEAAAAGASAPPIVKTPITPITTTLILAGVQEKVGAVSIPGAEFVANMSPEARAEAAASAARLAQASQEHVVLYENVTARVSSLGVAPDATAATVQLQSGQAQVLLSQAHEAAFEGRQAEAIVLASQASNIVEEIQRDHATAQVAVNEYRAVGGEPTTEVKNAIAKYGPGVWT